MSDTSLPADVQLLGRVRPITFPEGTASKVLATYRCRLLGWSFYATTNGVNDTLLLYDGEDDTGQLLGCQPLSANSPCGLFLPPVGIAVESALFAKCLASAVAGVVYVGPIRG